MLPPWKRRIVTTMLMQSFVHNLLASISNNETCDQDFLVIPKQSLPKLPENIEEMFHVPKVLISFSLSFQTG